MSGLHPGIIMGDMDKPLGSVVAEAMEYERQENEALAAQERLEEQERQAKENKSECEVEMPPKVALLAFKADQEQEQEETQKTGFQPVSEEEKRKGAALYVRRLFLMQTLMTDERKKALKKQNDENIRKIIRFQEQDPYYKITYPTPESSKKIIAFQYWKRRILLGNVHYGR